MEQFTFERLEAWQKARIWITYGITDTTYHSFRSGFHLSARNGGSTSKNNRSCKDNKWITQISPKKNRFI